MPVVTKVKFRSGLESAFSTAVAHKNFLYEPYRLPYVIHKKYIPDFIDERTGAMIECKGFFRVGDTQKYKAIRDSLFSQELVFVLTNADKKVRKGSKITMGEWCEKEGFKWFTLETLKELKRYGTTTE